MFDTWQGNLFFFYIFNVLFFQCYKLAVRKVKRDGGATIALQTIAGVSVLLLVPFFPIIWPSSTSIFLLLLASSVFYAINDRMQTTARKHLEVSTYTIIGQLAVVFVMLYGITIFRDQVSLAALLGAVLVVFANVMIFYHRQKRAVKVNKYVIVGMLAVAAFATALVIDVGIIDHFNLPIYISLTLLIPAVMVACAGRITPKQVMQEFNTNARLFLITGVTWALGIFFSLRSFQLGEVSTVIVLQAVAVILNVLAAYIFLKERSKVKRKLTAAVLIVFGIFLTV